VRRSHVINKKLQIGKDYDKKEQEYQKYMYYASKWYQYYGVQVKTSIQNYFGKVLYENLTFLPCGF
jgi:hypothetical protein